MIENDPRIDPAELRNVRFPGSSRRYDARAVDQFLASFVDRVEATNALVDDLVHRLDEVQATPTPAPAPTPRRSELSELSEDEIVALLGEETAAVLSTARRSAEEIRTKAEENAARVIREATAEAKRTVEAAGDRAVELTAEAEHVHAQAVSVAEADAERIRQDAQRDSHRVLAEAKERARADLASVETRRAEAQDEAARMLVEAREECRAMVAEAKELRGRVLDDLQRRRDGARHQIERLATGRDELLAAYDRVRASLDDITGHLASLPVPARADAEVGDDESLAPDGADGADGADRAGDDVDVVSVGTEDVVEDDTTALAEVAEVDDTVAAAPDVVDEDAEDVPVEDAPVQDADVVDVDAAASEDDDIVDLTSTEPDLAEDSDEADADDDDEIEAVEVQPEPSDGGLEPSGDVDALFARLRTEREANVARAHEVLADPAPDQDIAAPEPVTEAATTVEVPSGSVELVPASLLAPAELLEVRANAVEAEQRTLARSLKRRLADEQNEVLDRLRRSEVTSVEDLFLGEDEHRLAYAEAARGPVAAVVAVGAAVAGSADDVPTDHPAVVELSTALAEGLVDPFRRRVARAIEEVDGDTDALDDRLRALYREWKAQQLPAALDDTLLSAFGHGSLVGAGEGTALRWTIDPAQGPCPDAEDNALAGPVLVGVAYPTGDTCPQAHSGCRCMLVRAQD